MKGEYNAFITGARNGKVQTKKRAIMNLELAIQFTEIFRFRCHCGILPIP